MAKINRTTAKSNIVTKNVPTVTNTIMTDMLNADLADNIVFGVDVAVAQNSSASNITVDFTGKDRIDLTRTGGSLNITVAGIDDGEIKYLLISKTAGQVVSWVGVFDMTICKENADARPIVLYEIIRKATAYAARAWTAVEIASVAEHNALANLLKMCVPGRLPIASATQQGLQRNATPAEVAALTSLLLNVTPGALPMASASQFGLTASAALSTILAGVDNVTQVTPAGLSGSHGLIKIIDIGDWDMDATATKAVAHGVDASKIRDINVLIRADVASPQLTYSFFSQANNYQSVIFSSAGNIVLTRETGGVFDNANFNATSYNRGWVTIRYIL